MKIILLLWNWKRQLQQVATSLLSTQIVKNPSVKFLFHSDFDNFDAYVNRLHGAGSIHTAHGIMLQELSSGDHGGQSIITPNVEKTKSRSIDNNYSTDLPPCYVASRRSPDIKIVELQNVNSIEALDNLKV